MDDLRNRIQEEAHGSRYSIHLGSTKMYHDLRELFWWEVLKEVIAEFVAKCPNFQDAKAEHQKQSGLLQEIQVPTWKWEIVNMDFVVSMPRTQRKHYSIWVVVDRWTKYAHFIPIKSTYLTEDYARIFIDEIVCRHGILLSIVSDRGDQFKSRFWRSFQKRWGKKVKLSTGFHP